MLTSHLVIYAIIRILSTDKLDSTINLTLRLDRHAGISWLFRLRLRWPLVSTLSRIEMSRLDTSTKDCRLSTVRDRTLRYAAQVRTGNAYVSHPQGRIA